MAESTYEWESLVRQSKDEDLKKPSTAYEWSNGREDKSTDHTDTGVYER